LVDNYLAIKSTENLETGKLVLKEEFRSFSGYLVDVQIAQLKNQYKAYVIYRLSEFVKKVNKTKKKFQALENCLYVTRVGASVARSSLDHNEEHGNYFQIELDSERVLAEYLELFYKSKLGQLILESLNSGSFIPSISKSDLLNSTVAVPEIEDQRILIDTSSKLQSLQEILTQLQQELGLNPKNVSVLMEKYDAIQQPLKSMSQEDEVLGMIRKGEGKFIEFKQTFSRNLATSKKDVIIEKASLKTLVGFLNAYGGTLLIGVTDKGDVAGIEQDIFNSPDSYLLHFRNTINSKIGPEFYPHIDYDIVSILGKRILKVVCRPSSKPCFYDKKEFYVRTNPATDKLEGQQLIEYINHHYNT
jgi:hypothetical protein